MASVPDLSAEAVGMGVDQTLPQILEDHNPVPAQDNSVFPIGQNPSNQKPPDHHTVQSSGDIFEPGFVENEDGADFNPHSELETTDKADDKVPEDNEFDKKEAEQEGAEESEKKPYKKKSLPRNRPYDKVCDLCGKAYQDTSKLNRHKNEVHYKRRFFCQHCPRDFRTNREVRQHVAKDHLGRMDYLCDYCSKPFSDRSAMNRHVKNMHAEVKEVTAIPFYTTLKNVMKIF